MSRKQQDTAVYFPHYGDSSSGDTLTILQSRFGNNGYAVWFKLLEKLTTTEGHYLDCRNDIKWKLLVVKLGTDEETTVEILNLLVEMEAIDQDLWASRVIWCQKLVDNLSDVYKNRKRNPPSKPIIPSKKDITTVEKDITTVEKPQSKVEYSRVKKSKEYIKHKFGEYKNVLLTEEQHNKLIDKFGVKGTSDRIKRLSEGIELKGYKYKNHYLAILKWEERDNNGTHKGINRGIPGNQPSGAFDDLE